MTTQMSFLGHLDELRSRLVKASIAVTLTTILGFVFNEQILDILARPYEQAVGKPGLAFFRPTEAFSMVMRVSLFAGIIAASPVWLYQTWRFVSPALSKREKKYVVPMMAVLVVLFLGGVGLGYWSLERGLEFLIDFGGDRLEPVIGASFYLSFAMRFILAFGLAFEFPVFLFSLAAVGALSSRRLRDGRRWAILIIVVAAAVITPSGDPVTLLLLSAPLYILYELTIVAIRVVLRK